MTGARELLANAADELGYATDARVLREGKGAFIQVNAALRAIESLLTALDAAELRLAEAERVIEQAAPALDGMMRTWLDYHDAHSLTEPVTRASGNAFDRALEVRDAALAFLNAAGGE